MKKFSLLVISILLLSVCPASAYEVTPFSKNYIRIKGAPVEETDSFYSYTGPAVLRVYINAGNDSLDKGRIVRIAFNGIDLIAENIFTQDNYFLVTDIVLEEYNTISVELRGKPGLIMNLDVVQEIPINDYDGDSVPDESDNCPDLPNLDQSDADGDGIGDVCDLFPGDPYLP